MSCISKFHKVKELFFPFLIILFLIYGYEYELSKENG